jgi:hypothetical protein
MIKLYKSTVMNVQNMVFQFGVTPTSKTWFLKIVQVTMKYDPFDVM